MITTAAADTLAGLFAGAPATAGDIAVGSGPVFGQMLATNVAVPAAATVMPPFRTIPGIATLPIGTLVGTGSLPFSASSMPAALAWSASKLPLVPGGMTTSSDTSVATLSAPVLNMPPSPTSLPAAVSAGPLPTAIKQVEPAAVVSIRPIADEVAGAAAVTRTGPRTEAPWRDEVIVDQPVSHIDPASDQESITASPGSAAQGGGVKTGPIRAIEAPIPSSADVMAAMPVADSNLVLGDEQAPLPGTAENVTCEENEPGVGEAPVEVTHTTPVSADIPAVMIDPAMAMTEEKTPQPAKTANVKPVESELVTPETQVATTPATLSPGETPTPRPDQGVVVANARTPSSGRIGTARRTETRDATPEKSVAADSDIPMVPIPLALSTAPSVTPVIVSKGDDPAVPDEDASDTSDPKPVEDSVSPAGAIPLPIEMAVVPAKTALATIVTERPVAASAPTLHPASIAAEPVDGPPSTAVDTSDIVLSHPNTALRADGVTHEEARVGESRQPMAQPASFATLVNRAESTAAPAPTAAAPAPPAEPRVAVQPGRMGQEMGVAIARHAATGGREAMTVRLDPVEFGRIEVTLSFDDSGTIRAVVAAESPAALDLLRRDSADLGRSLAEAGIRSDAQSFRFDTRQGSADGSGQGGQRWQQQSAAGTRTVAQATDDNPEPVYRPLRTQGRVDLMA